MNQTIEEILRFHRNTILEVVAKHCEAYADNPSDWTPQDHYWACRNLAEQFRAMKEPPTTTLTTTTIPVTSTTNCKYWK